MLLLTRLQLVVIGINLSTSANVRPRRLFFIDRVFVLSRVVKQPGLTPNPRIISLPVDTVDFGSLGPPCSLHRID